MKKLVMILFAALLVGSLGTATPMKHASTSPVVATIDGWTPWANANNPPPPPSDK